jgi:acyl-coenzyme A thioesterase PaaI-like protein
MTVSSETRSRTITWQDPAILRAAAAELDGRAFLQIHGRALPVGGHIAFAEAHARNDAGELVGHATTSLAVFRAEPPS